MHACSRFFFFLLVWQIFWQTIDTCASSLFLMKYPALLPRARAVNCEYWQPFLLFLKWLEVWRRANSKSEFYCFSSATLNFERLFWLGRHYLPPNSFPIFANFVVPKKKKVEKKSLGMKFAFLQLLSPHCVASLHACQLGSSEKKTTTTMAPTTPTTISRRFCAKSSRRQR